jgi:surface antigen
MRSPRARIGLLALPTLLAACGGTPAPNLAAPHYAGLSCAPFARALTGVDLHGPAASWWGEAAGRYVQSHRPQTGSILVLAATDRLPSGHVSVVSQVQGPRDIAVIQANWVPGVLARDEKVVDVSAANDWTLVRVWYAPVGAMGVHAYPALGFIVPDAPAGHAALSAQAAAAARTAAGG